MCVSPADPPHITGDMESAVAVDLNPWVEYEFRVVATNAISTGDPSAPSSVVQSQEAGMMATCAVCVACQSRLNVEVRFSVC